MEPKQPQFLTAATPALAATPIATPFLAGQNPALSVLQGAIGGADAATAVASVPLAAGAPRPMLFASHLPTRLELVRTMVGRTLKHLANILKRAIVRLLKSTCQNVLKAAVF